MPTRRVFPTRVLSLLKKSAILRIRAGAAPHRFISIWCVVVAGRVFVRPWNDKAAGWHKALLRERTGAIEIGGREIPVRARPARGERLFDAVDAAYATRYPTKGSLKWVRGFAEPRRRKTTTELLPRTGRKTSG
ncbi:MAG: DUF2255 family protein [Acidobacteria bacterium]|nr:DUF2255 family protein [Acidobacteriota bacterium]